MIKYELWIRWEETRILTNDCWMFMGISVRRLWTSYFGGFQWISLKDDNPDTIVKSIGEILRSKNE